MAQGDDSSGEKVHDPTPQKLEEARRKGDVPRSMDVSAAAGFIGLFVAVIGTGTMVLEQTGGLMTTMIARSTELAPRVLGPGGPSVLGPILTETLRGITPILLIPFVAALLSLVAQRAFVASTDKITPKFSRLSIIANAGNKFGPTGLVQFAKSVVKMLAIGFALVTYLSSRQDELIGSVRGDGWSVAGLIGETLLTLLAITCAIYGIIGLIDLLWQNFDHARKLRMSFQDLKDETKQSEGDPHVKQQRRQKGMEIASNHMLQDVPTADVVIVNPTHYAVALTWSGTRGTAPVVVAKGVDVIAARIRTLAAENGVPIHSDPPTARAIHDLTEIGDEIAPEHYRAVAAAIRFAETMRKKARSMSWN